MTDINSETIMKPVDGTDLWEGGHGLQLFHLQRFDTLHVVHHYGHVLAFDFLDALNKGLHNALIKSLEWGDLTGIPKDMPDEDVYQESLQRVLNDTLFLKVTPLCRSEPTTPWDQHAHGMVMEEEWDGSAMAFFTIGKTPKRNECTCRLCDGMEHVIVSGFHLNMHFDDVYWEDHLQTIKRLGEESDAKWERQRPKTAGAGPS